jgi:hypothetical protein
MYVHITKGGNSWVVLFFVLYPRVVSYCPSFNPKKWEICTPLFNRRGKGMKRDKRKRGTNDRRRQEKGNNARWGGGVKCKRV